jgi:hypothetical protein
MKKVFVSIIVPLIVLTTFGLIVVGVIANPTDSGPNTEALIAPVNVNEEVQAPLFVFDPEAVNYEISQPDYEWLELSDSSDEQITVDEIVDNVGSAEIDLGFYFPFFTEIYRQVRLSDNGYIYFGGEEAEGGNTPQAIPADVDLIHNFIAPFGADLFRYPGDSTVYIARQSEPERHLVLQFQNAYWCCNLEAPNNFQVVLYPDGRILTQYKSIHSENPPHAYLTVGLENENGTRGYDFYTGYLDETDSLHDQLAVLYDPSDTVLGRILFIPETVSAQGTPSQTITLNADLLNLSGVDSSFTITHTMQVNGVEVSNLVETLPDSKTTWRFDILSEPSLVANTYAAPLAVAVVIPELAAEGDTAVITFRALPEAISDFTPTVTFTVEVITTNDQE